MIVTISKTVDVEVEVELGEFSDDELIAEYKERGLDMFNDDGDMKGVTAQQIFDHFHLSRERVPDILREYLFQETGRTLP